MAEGPLVNEQIESGARFITEFQKAMPVKAAFWLQESERNYVHLYLVPDTTDDVNSDLNLPHTGQIAQAMHDPNFSVLDVMIISADDPRARAALEITQRYPGRIAPHYRRRRFGNITAEEVYIYPLPITVGA